MRRAAIQQAALDVFSECGYTRATMREIARRAGVTHGLVQRHFGSKEALFLATVPGTRDWESVIIQEGKGSLAERIAAAFTDRGEAGTGLDALVALLRSTASDIGAAKKLYGVMRDGGAALYEPYLKGKDVALQSDVILAVMIGFTFSRHVAGGGRLAELSTADLKRCLAQTLVGLLPR
ncbi:TetR/AcrR family transcriptional regulator [Achromobacter pulmonis]|nr:TetR/AcrR family transcriptional regulator [Achromobacter pulmonis]